MAANMALKESWAEQGVMNTVNKRVHVCYFIWPSRQQWVRVLLHREATHQKQLKLFRTE